MTTLTPQMQRERARAAVDRFVGRFGEPYRVLAYYAALPLVLTPDLLHYLRNEFLRDRGVPWVAEADLLLSDLCRPVGYELYVVDTAVRAYLLEDMECVLGQSQMEAVARLLISYLRYLMQNSPQLDERELEAQQWAAMVYLEARRETVVREIAGKFLHATLAAEPLAGESLLVSQQEMARLARITRELAPQLREYPALVEYAATIAQLLRAPREVLPHSLRSSYRITADVELEIPESLLPTLALKPDASEILSKPILEGGPKRQVLEFETAQLVDPDEEALSATDWVPPLETESVTVVTIALEPATEESPEAELEAFEFESARIARTRKRWAIRKTRRHGHQFIEQLIEGVQLEMVAIPGGTFLMGSPKDESERENDEGPQHEVTIPPLFISKYPVTQAQWKFVVAELPQVKCELPPLPSNFKGSDRPVEQISWYEAVEFCDRLAACTGRPCRLPSEAEWEYACRAGTTTPFHFGETISPALANYNSTSTYSNGPKGKYRQKSTPVGSFPANDFGLYDMHGNVLEWCQDQYHEKYAEGVFPCDGSAWEDRGKSAERILRGGAWFGFPRWCRSAYRYHFNPGARNYAIGFRVACAAPRT
ncbi:hypothetical protein KR51_00015680 [Rubidibacter lacunae KORDI 51-2]|uniref:Sulfatase-modifying factor enzyme-like domain-containing protein n=1 Tax=Rubidibacter lacunae KORDI 51-2 TaxID=582515 RepID=U5DLG9_9CHRO|nr:formylglycine-generating enzyme family protein [Rubidibacter lacunae]ERN41722.1 hypothetical protein KR51_00015680 [Rubidibacter lacunae KORDI 51-2]